MSENIQDALSAMHSYGFNVTNIIIGKLIRFSTHTHNKKDKSGWYSFNLDNGILLVRLVVGEQEYHNHSQAKITKNYPHCKKRKLSRRLNNNKQSKQN